MKQSEHKYQRIYTGLSLFNIMIKNLRILIVLLFFGVCAIYVSTGSQIYNGGYYIVLLLASIFLALGLYFALYIYFGVRKLKTSKKLEGKEFTPRLPATINVESNSRIAQIETNLSLETSYFNRAFLYALLNLYKYFIPFCIIVASFFALTFAYFNFIYELSFIKNYYISIVFNSFTFIIVLFIITPLASFLVVKKVSNQNLSVSKYFSFLLKNALGQTFALVFIALISTTIIFTIAILKSYMFQFFVSMVIIPIFAFSCYGFLQILLIKTFIGNQNSELTDN